MKKKIVLLAYLLMTFVFTCNVYAEKITDESFNFYYFGNKESTFDYDDDWFVNSAFEFNTDLAENSLKLACSAFGYFEKKNDYSKNYQNAEKFLEKIHMSGIYHNKQYELDPERNSIGLEMGYKKISDDVTLIAIAIRGGGYKKEWAGNFSIGDSSSVDHEGFSIARDIVISELKSYISNKKISGRVKLWITGYSRAGAVANLVAAWLDDNALELGIDCSNEDIFAYCFETPLSTTSVNAHIEKYNNIYCISNSGDMIPQIPCSLWGFTCYGHMGIIGYVEAKEVEEGLNELLSVLTALAETRDEYYSNFQPVFVDKIEEMTELESVSTNDILVLLMDVFDTGTAVYGEDFLEERNIDISALIKHFNQFVAILGKHAQDLMMECFKSYRGRILFDDERYQEYNNKHDTEPDIETETETETETEIENASVIEETQTSVFQKETATQVQEEIPSSIEETGSHNSSFTLIAIILVVAVSVTVFLVIIIIKNKNKTK